LDSGNSRLIVDAPEVEKTQIFNFKIVSVSSGITTYKEIILIVKNSGPSKIVETAIILSLSATLLCVVTGTSIYIAGHASTSSIWSLINEYQMLMLLPILDKDLPKDIIDFIKGMSFSLFSIPIFSSEYLFPSTVHNYFN
jgi:hypothetical protein